MSSSILQMIEHLVEEECAVDSVEELQKILFKDVLDDAKAILRTDGPDDSMKFVVNWLKEAQSANWQTLYDFYESLWEKHQKQIESTE